MPVSYEPIRPHSAKPFQTLADAVGSGLVIMLRCYICHQKTNFLAEDLASVPDPWRSAHYVPFKCSRCKTIELIAVRLNLPSSNHRGELMVRRPAKCIERWKWRTVSLSY
jgi:hypothetical protein